MTRLAGGLLLWLGSALLGLSASRRLGARSARLRGLVSALEYMEVEIGRSLSPMDDVCARLSGHGDAAVADFFRRVGAGLASLDERGFAGVWRAAVAESPALLLRRDETEELAELGNYLGRYGAPAQERAIAACRARLQECLAASRREAAEKGRLCLGLGAAAGGMLALLLM